MPTTVWQCDECQVDRPLSEVLRCLLCSESDPMLGFFVGNCCSEKHCQQQHPNIDKSGVLCEFGSEMEQKWLKKHHMLKGS